MPNWSRNLFEKAELLSLPNTCKATQEWKREGEALTSPGNPLTNLTTIKLSRKRSPGTSSRTCVDSMRCKVHPELFLFTPLNPTHKETIWPGLSGGWLFCANLWLSDKLRGTWSGHGLVWRSAERKMVWSEVCYVEHGLDWASAAWKKGCTGSLLRGKRDGLEVCCEENGLVWMSAARKMVCSSGVPV